MIGSAPHLAQGTDEPLRVGLDLDWAETILGMKAIVFGIKTIRNSVSKLLLDMIKETGVRSLKQN